MRKTVPKHLWIIWWRNFWWERGEWEPDPCLSRRDMRKRMRELRRHRGAENLLPAHYVLKE